MAKSNFFRVAVEGATTDGRAIDRKWLEEIAETYNRETYAARVNMEHIRGVTAEPPFQSLGDVLSVKTEEVTLDLAGKQEKRLALFAEIDALEPLVKMNQARQKIYSSIEINPSFAGTGKAYLVGLAVTDSPASLGTQMLQFCAAQGENSPLAARKQDPANLISEGTETKIELASAPEVQADPTGIFASIKSLMDRFTPAAPAPEPVKVDEPAASAAQPGMVEMAAAFGQMAGTLQSFMGESAARETKLRADLDALSAKLEATPAPGFTQRPLSTGGATAARTDC